MPDVTPKYSKEEFARRGEEVFARDVREKVSGEAPQDFVAIDIESGDFSVDADMLEAMRRLRERRPNAQIWTRQVDSPYAFRFGGRAAP